MSWFYTRCYLITHIFIGMFIIGFEFFYRWIIQTYQIHIRTCPDVFYIEFKQLNNIQTLNWFENKINNLIEALFSMNDQCSTKELKFNFKSIFIFLRYLWLSISSIYCCLALRHLMKRNCHDVSCTNKE